MIDVAPLTGTVGAEIRGLNLKRPVDDEDRSALLVAWTEWKVLFFRDQRINLDEQIAFATIFGEVAEHGTFGAAGPVSDVEHDRDRGRGLDAVWHSDSSFWAEPPSGSVLRCVETPAVGGDTCFADMAAAYDGLSEPMKYFLSPLRAVHDVTLSATHPSVGLSYDDAEAIRKRFPPIEHPLIRTHPVSKRKAIYAPRPTATRIVGLTDDESNLILEFLFRQAAIPEFQCRFRWERDSVAVWDNRVLQHYAVYDYWPARRSMVRVFLGGEKPL